MRAPLSWIREFTSLEAEPAEIAAALDQLGLEVEAVDEPGREIVGVRVAKILDIVAHPDADKLRLADVDYGAGLTRVVCGAPNIAVGMVVPFAPVGASLPGGFVLERRKIRGVVSDGMLCSARELGFSDDHAGIFVLDPATELGIDLRAALGLDDVVFDLSITPNRPDAMGVVGVARELAAHFGLPFSVPDVPASAVGGAAAGEITVAVEAPERCGRFVGRVARVAMGSSPEWMARRLTLAGMRPISNVVDITNYVMLERCRPLHAFDLARLPGRGIIVRLARDGEQITTLDDVVRTLTAEDLLICDAERGPQAIAGIMGAADAEVCASTTEILLESAYFGPAGISKSSKRLGLRSEASARFERGVDPDGCDTGADVAMALLERVAGAQVLDGRVDVCPEPFERERITVRTARVGAVLGLDVTQEQIVDALTPLGIDCVVSTPAALVAVVPTYRPDLEREIDVIEEVARRIGLDRLPRTLPDTSGQQGGLTPRQHRRRLVADVFVGAGYCEAYTLPLLAPSDLERAGISADGVVESANPLRAEESVLRTSIRPGLLRAWAHNASQGLLDVALFELGKVFFPPRAGDVLPDERDMLAFLVAGTVRRSPVESDRAIDAYDGVDTFRALVEALELADVELEPAGAAGFHPTRSVAVMLEGEVIGHVGEADPAVLSAFDLGGPVVLGELDLDALLAGRRRDRTFVLPSRYPASSIDLAFVVDELVPACAIEATLRRAGGELLEAVRCFDVFRSEALGAGRKSLAFALRFRSPDRTLTDDEVGELRRRGIEAVAARHDAELRG